MGYFSEVQQSHIHILILMHFNLKEGKLPGSFGSRKRDLLNPAFGREGYFADFTSESFQHSGAALTNSDIIIHRNSRKRTKLIQPTIKASYGPLAVDASIPAELLLSGRRIIPVILARQVRSSSPLVKILFHIAKERAHCVTAYAFWETKEVRGACLLSPGGFCVAQLKLEPSWFNSASRSGSSSREAGRTEEIKGLQETLVEVYFQSRRDPTGQCAPQDSLQRVGVGRSRDSGGSGTPMRRIGSVTLLKAPGGNPTFLRLRLGGSVVIQTSSKPIKSTDVATFYIFLTSTSTLENFTLSVWMNTIPEDQLELSLNSAGTHFTCKINLCPLLPNRGLLEVLQLDFSPKDISDQAESHSISWRLELPENVKDVEYQVNNSPLFPLSAQTTDILNTAVLTGKMVSVPVKTLAVDVDGSVSDVTNYTSCKSTAEDVLKVSERCNFIYVNGKEARGRTRAMVNFTYAFLSAQLEMSVWMPRLPLLIDVADPELSQIKGWRVPVTTGNRRSTWDSEEDEEMRKGRGCMLQYQHSTLRVLTPFIVQPDPEVDVTNLVRDSLKAVDPDVARVLDGMVLQGRGVGTTVVVSPLTLSVLAERTIKVLDDKVSVTELGVQLVSGLSLSLQLSPGSNRAVIATHFQVLSTTKRIRWPTSCWVQFSDGAVTPLELFDRSVYSLTVSTSDERVATVRRTPQSTFVVAQSESEGRGKLVKVELRICEECQKSKRKSKLAVGAGLLKTSFQTEGKKNNYGNMFDNANLQTNNDNPNAEIPKKEPPKSKPPKLFEGDLIRTFKAMSDMEIGMYALVGVSCIAILAFLLNCASYNLCFRKSKTPIQTTPAPSTDPKEHKHDWVWLGGGSQRSSSPAQDVPAQVSTLKREPSCPLESHHSIDSMGHSSIENTLPTVSAVNPMAIRSATLLARPHRSEPLHSPTSKRNQVQFTTFTTLDINHYSGNFIAFFSDLQCVGLFFQQKRENS
uniref:Si:dkey-1d7.3 n=1 Tax=Oryzias sinensis TaxID=183150 RepID=A0A8C8DKG6_9TELE